MEQLSEPQQERLLASLSTRLKKRSIGEHYVPRGTRSVLDIHGHKMGPMLRPFSPDDDILGEMLEGSSGLS